MGGSSGSPLFTGCKVVVMDFSEWPGPVPISDPCGLGIKDEQSSWEKAPSAFLRLWSHPSTEDLALCVAPSVLLDQISLFTPGAGKGLNGHRHFSGGIDNEGRPASMGALQV